jgi:hypothetical protein
VWDKAELLAQQGIRLDLAATCSQQPDTELGLQYSKTTKATARSQENRAHLHLRRRHRHGRHRDVHGAVLAR